MSIRRLLRRVWPRRHVEDWRPRVNCLESRVADLASLEHRIVLLESEQVFARKLLSEQVMLDRQWVADLIAGRAPKGGGES